MPRNPRLDAPNTWHHVMNRGIARRTMFESEQDMRVFLDQLGASIERGEIEVHAYVLMGTHYHLLVRSLTGNLATAMQRIQTEFSRWFNRSRKRDGTLVRARYRSLRINSLEYRRAVVAYIDRNPVAAGIVPRAEEYPHGSAREYVRSRGSDTGWLERSWVEAAVKDSLGLAAYVPLRYPEVFGRLPDALARVVEARWRSRSAPDPLDDLLAATPPRIRDWMTRKAVLADGTMPGLPVLDLESLERSIREAELAGGGEWTIGCRSGWTILRAGLARSLAGSRLAEIGATLHLAASTAGTLTRQHDRLQPESEVYAERAAQVVDEALGVWPGRTSSNLRHPCSRSLRAR